MSSLADQLKLGLDDGSASGGAGNGTELAKRADHLATGRLPYRELQQLYEEVADKLRKVANEKDELSLLAEQRQQAFQRTEAKYQEDMRALEVRLQKMGVEDRSRMDPLRNLHGNIQDTINSIQNKTARVLQDQERDLIRAFRARLADVTVELENERRRSESGSAEWVARCRKLTEELEWLRDLTDKLTSENKSVLKDNRRFKRQMKTQEEDREFLIKQLVSVKKENARLRYSFDQLMAGNVQSIGLAPTDQQQPLLPPGTGNISSITGMPMSQSKGALRAGTPVTGGLGTPFGSGSRSAMPSRPQSAFVGAASTGGMGRPGTAGTSRPGTAAPGMIQQQQSTGALDSEKEFRYKALVNKLQRQVEDDAKKYRVLKTNYTAELAGRTELQAFVKKCIDDVRQDMAERGRSATLRRAQGAHRATSAGAMRAKQALPPPIDPRTIPLSEFTPQDRINVMEWLLSQDEVIFMLYEKIFPTARPQVGMGQAGQDAGSGAAASTAAGGEMDFSKLTGAPGSLFTTSSAHQQHRPHSSIATNHAQSTTIKARPQTAGPSQTRANAGQTQQPQQSYDVSGKVQYERPLGSRPLSGYELPSTSSRADAKQRPHTAVSSHSSTAGTQSDYQAEVEAEMRAARRPTTTGGDEDDEEATGAGDRSFDEAGRLGGLEEDDEDEDRQVYEHKDREEEED